MINSSQDPDYVGPVGHEKKFHKTHFHALRTLRKTNKQSKYEWVKIGIGKYKLVKRDELNR